MSTANQSGGPVQVVLDLLKNLLGRVAASEAMQQKLIAKSETLSKVIEEDAELKKELAKLDPRDLVQVQSEIATLQKQMSMSPSGPSSVATDFLSTPSNTPVSLPSPTNFFGARQGFMTLGQAMDGQMNAGFLSGPAVMKQLGDQLTDISNRLGALEKGKTPPVEGTSESTDLAKLAEVVKDLGAKVETLAIEKGDPTPPAETPDPEPQGSSETPGTSMEDTPPADAPEAKFEKKGGEPPVFGTADLWGGFQRTDKN